MRPADTWDRPAGPAKGDSPAGRVLGFFGLAWDAPVTAPPGELSLSQPGRADSDPASLIRPARQPKTIGEPIHPSREDAPLRFSSWVTQPPVSADGGTLGTLTVRAASVNGRRHARGGESREDAFAIGQTSDGTVAVAVADGLGDHGARYSAVGAQVASMLSCQLVCARLERRQAIDAEAVCAQLGSEMMKAAPRFIAEPCKPLELATTLITVWVSAEGAYRGFMIGDGGVFELAAGDLSAVTSPRGGPFGETEALPSAYSRVDRFSGRLEEESALVVATDGLSEPMRLPEVAQVLARAWERPPAILDFLYDMSFERRGESDDRTAASVWFAPRGVVP